MCFNMALVKERDALEQEFHAVFEDIPLLDHIAGPEQKLSYYNRSGFSHPIWPVITAGNPGAIALHSWGLIPHWTKDRTSALSIRDKTLNARSESAWEKPSFRASIPTQRCLIIADGFYEPHKFENRSYPFFIYKADHTPLTLAGIFAEWTGPETGKTIRTFSILTTQAVGLIDAIHNAKHRMPVIIEEKDRGLWLDTQAPRPLISQLCEPVEHTNLRAHPVTTSFYAHGESTNTPDIQNPVKIGIPAIDELALQCYT